MKSISKGIFLIAVFSFLTKIGTAELPHPHILVNSSDKAVVLQKIAGQTWAKSIFEEMKKGVDPYVERHQTNREWILSRYLMNRVPGKRYTRAYSDNGGSQIVRFEGDAPFPTVRITSKLRAPVTEKGSRYIRPSLEELVPYDTSRVMEMLNTETKRKEKIDPQTYVTDINGQINDLAQDAALVYWLTGEEKYARFAADILDQWVKGAYFQEPIIGACRTGYLEIQTLGDAAYRPLILAYDFVYPFMKKAGYSLDFYETVFEKFASTLAFRGFWNNNWYAAESSTMVFASLSLENQQKRDYYLQFYLSKDTTNRGCGQLGLPSTVEKWLTHDGHWKEPGGYHNYPVTNLLVSAVAMEKNGYDIFRKFPALFRASYAMLKYSFPNLTVSAFGDTGRASQSPESLEIGLVFALKYNQPELPEMLASMKKLIDGGRYSRDRSGFMGLLCYLPEIPEVKSVYSWPRSGELEFARYFLQRNGTDPATGLMYGVQGASYNHNHCNGMAMELYGCGQVMGIDAGTGPNYEHPLHVNYFSQWAAHNTVVAAGASSSVPFSGSAGQKNIGQIELVAMEPLPDQEAVSADYSFTETSYLDKSTNTNQLRTMAIIRTSPSTGYYVDIYRSDNAISNDYVYHNIGDTLLFSGMNRKPLATVSTTYPLTGKDYPGFRFYTGVRKLENYSGSLVALFPVKGEDSKELFMQALIPGGAGRTYYQAKSLKTHTAGRLYNEVPLPVFTIRTTSEAWKNPFVAVYEPFSGSGNQTVTEVEKLEEVSSAGNTVLKVRNTNKSSQFIFQGNDNSRQIKGNSFSFRGYFGVASLNNGKLEKLYLGRGSEISYGPVSIAGSSDLASAEVRMVSSMQFQITCNREIILGLMNKKATKATLEVDGKQQPVNLEKTSSGLKVNIPEVTNAILTLK